MKILNNLFIFSALTLGLNVYSQDISTSNFAKIESIKLNNGIILNVQKEVEFIQLALDRRNKIDYIELLEGTVIDSYDIERLILKKPTSQFPLNDLLDQINSKLILSRVMGDGSGG